MDSPDFIISMHYGDQNRAFCDCLTNIINVHQTAFVYWKVGYLKSKSVF